MCIRDRYNYIFAAFSPSRTDAFQLHDLTLDCNANGQIGRASNYTNGATWCGILTCGNNIVISNVTVIHFGNQGNTLELFPLSIGQESSCMALDENTHIITLYSNITVQDSTLTDPATSNSTLAGVCLLYTSRCV